MQQVKPRSMFCLLGGMVIFVIAINMRLIAVEQIDSKGRVILMENSYEAQQAVSSERLLRFMENSSTYGNVTLQYLALPSDCEIPELPLLDYTNLCWSNCGDSRCDKYDVKSIEKAGIHGIVCAPKIFLLGVRKSGTTDLSGWLERHSRVLSYNRDFESRHSICAVKQAHSFWKDSFLSMNLKPVYLQKNMLFNDAPGQLIQTQNHGFSNQSRVLKVRAPMQLIQPIIRENTRFIVILRDPVERAISQLFEWKKMNLLEGRTDPLDQLYIHQTVTEQIEKVTQCFMKYGPRACIYMTSARDGDINALLLWGLYVEYLEEAFKFVSRSQFMIISLDEYSRREAATMRKVFKFVDLPYQNYGLQQNIRLNAREGVQAFNSTKQLLAKFYQPFNRRLVDLLGNDKWCFQSC